MRRRRGSWGSTGGQLAIARISPLSGFIAIAVAPSGLFASPTSASTFSASAWILASIVRLTSPPRTAPATVSRLISSPSASRVTASSPSLAGERRRPRRPRSRTGRCRRCPTAPISRPRSPPAGRRAGSRAACRSPADPSPADLLRVGERDLALDVLEAGLRAEGLEQLLGADVEDLARASPRSSRASRPGTAWRRSSPRPRRRRAPCRADRGCCRGSRAPSRSRSAAACASALSSPPLTACSQAARAITPQKASAKTANSRPTRLSISFTARPLPVASYGVTPPPPGGAAPVAGSVVCVGVVPASAGGAASVAGACVASSTGATVGSVVSTSASAMTASPVAAIGRSLGEGGRDRQSVEHRDLAGREPLGRRGGVAGLAFR